MSDARDRLARQHAKARRKRRARRAVLPGLLLSCGIALLFALAWGANEREQLAHRQTRLLQERTFEQDELLRLRSAWSRATARDRVVQRAVAELQLVESADQPKEVLVLRDAPPAPPARTPLEALRAPQWLARAGRAIGKFGRITEAAAKEGQP